MSTLISIIVPVYNVDGYLQECLESISTQTYPHLECLLVNDGSTDKSVDICKQFCEKDLRFHLLHQEKQGVAAARNRGMEEAKGEYFLFVDGDDILFPDTLQIAWQELDSGPFDWIMFDYIKASSFATSLPEYSKIEAKDFVPDRLDRDAAVLELFECPDPVYCVVWNKLYTRRIIGDIRFKNVSYAEDVLFNYEVFRQTRQSLRIHRCLYFWRIRQGSLTSVHSPERILTQFKSLFLLENLSREDQTSMRGICLKNIYRQILITRFHLMGTPLYSNFLSLTKEMKDSTFREYWSNNSVSLFEKIRYLLLWSCPHVMKAILKAMGN